VQIDYEGRWTIAKCESVIDSEFPPHMWHPLESEWQSTFSRQGYIEYVEKIRDEISRGNVYQVNACRILSTDCTQSLAGLFNKILKENPAPYAAYFRLGNKEIASASPELLLKIEKERECENGNRVTSSPIKGTSKTPQFAEKDYAENVMIVDLIRNDMNQICEEGSLDVSRLLDIETHPGLFHLVSDVTGLLRGDFSWAAIGDAMLPAGSISGAPKSTAVKIIDSSEKYRGPYCGILGYLDRKNGELSGVLSVGIRLFWRGEGSIYFGTGAGITWGSDPVAEWDETELIANRLIAIASGKDMG
jgi:para-aminobenzoate synthetase component 1